MSITENIIHDIRRKNNKGYNVNKNPNYHLLNLLHKPFPSIKFKNASTKEIERIINSLKIEESSGYDEIPTKILKTSAPFISSPLSYICYKSMLSGTFPTRLKYAIVKPLLKKGDKENEANYRPISLLASFSKTLDLYRVSQEECVRLQEGVPYDKVYRYNPKHLYPKLNGYGDNGQRKVWSSGWSTHCTCQLTSPIDVCP